MSLDDNTIDWVLNKINAHISECNRGLEELENIDKSDLNLQVVEDVAIVLTIKRDAMLELKREIERT